MFRPKKKDVFGRQQKEAKGPSDFVESVNFYFYHHRLQYHVADILTIISLVNFKEFPEMGAANEIRTRDRGSPARQGIKRFSDPRPRVNFRVMQTEHIKSNEHSLFPRHVIVTETARWNEWSPWSPCSAPCDGGRQIRSRDCPREANTDRACVGVGQESRSCNVFSCAGSHDLLTLMGARSLPPGVTKSNGTSDGEYVITKVAQLSLPASRVYDVTLPSRFSILMELKVDKSKKRRYVFVVSDQQRRQQMAVFLGRRVKFHYLGNNYGFKVDLLDNEWHAISLTVDRDRVSLIVDCDIVFSRKLRTIDQYLGTNLIMSIGPYFPEHGKMFEVS
ncbi:hypothetical protein EGW08_000846, partial [Elysia chlorotica]